MPRPSLPAVALAVAALLAAALLATKPLATRSVVALAGPAHPTPAAPAPPRAPARVSSVAYRVLSVEALLCRAPPRVESGDPPPPPLGDDAAWRVEPGTSEGAAAALRAALAEADGAPASPPTTSEPGRGLQWTLVATWDASALVVEGGPSADRVEAARARRVVAVPMPPPDTAHARRPWSPADLLVPPPHPDPPPRPSGRRDAPEPPRPRAGAGPPTGPDPPAPSDPMVEAWEKAEAALARGDATGAGARLEAAAAGVNDVGVARLLRERAAVARWRASRAAATPDADRLGPEGAAFARLATWGLVDARGDATVGVLLDPAHLAAVAHEAQGATEARALAGAATAAGAFGVAALAGRRALDAETAVGGASPLHEARRRTVASLARRAGAPSPGDAEARLGGPGGRR